MSSDAIRVIAELNINAGQLEEFKSAATNLAAAAGERDPGTIRFEWYLDESAGTCTVIEE